MYEILEMQSNIYVHNVDKRLKETSNENPVLPIYIISAVMFDLKKIGQKK